MNAPLDTSALRIRIPAERWEACKGGILENACLRSIGDEQAEPGTWLYDAVTYAYDAARATGEDRALFIADMEEAFAAELEAEQINDALAHRVHLFEARTGKPADLIQHSTSAWGMASHG